MANIICFDCILQEIYDEAFRRLYRWVGKQPFFKVYQLCKIKKFWEILYDSFQS